jgi:uncharacterized membrane protein
MSSEIFKAFFVDPILQNGWFNPVNTPILALMLVAGVLLVYKMLERMNIKIDRRFFLAILPFIIWAPLTRVIRDFSYALAQGLAAQSGTHQQFTADIIFQAAAIKEAASAYVMAYLPVQGFADFYGWIIALFPTPGSYVITFMMALAALIVSLIIQTVSSKVKSGSSLDYWKIMFIIGLILLLWNIYIFPPITDLFPLLLVAALVIVSTGVFYIIRRLHYLRPGLGFLPRLLSNENLGILSAHFLDASATFVALTYYGYLEQHIVPRMLFSVAGNASFFALKIAVLLPVLYLIDRYAEEGSFKNLLKIVILILGLAPGLRDLARLMAGV